ncbi:DNA-directed RNA polymerase subunit E'' [Candidatus Woesearchaeota archaeon]|nr:MAG: DNA-directed RNA polymerase subunit E'' [Candidatus Woesearchaeota archaeon]
MAKKKACKHDKFLTEEDTCPLCKGNKFVLNWKGRMYILDYEKSEIAKKIGITANGEYAIKVS